MNCEIKAARCTAVPLYFYNVTEEMGLGMTILELYERVNLICPLDQRRFFNFYNDTVAELDGLYGTKKTLLFRDGTDVGSISSLDCESRVLPLYDIAVADNILFLCGQGEAFKSEFMRKAQDAYLWYWNNDAKNRRLRRGAW